jgi:hypothetical protein
MTNLTKRKLTLWRKAALQRERGRIKAQGHGLVLTEKDLQDREVDHQILLLTQELLDVFLIQE